MRHSVSSKPPTTDVLDSPAVTILRGLKDASLDLMVVAGRLRVSPAERLTAEHEQLIRQHRDALVTLVRICDQGVQERVAIFRAQLEADPTHRAHRSGHRATGRSRRRLLACRLKEARLDACTCR